MSNVYTNLKCCICNDSMSNVNTITSLHVQKLGHKIEEIRCRALDNIISKLEHGFDCDCQGVKRELLSKLCNWFSFDNVPHPARVLDLIHYLISDKSSSSPNLDPRLLADLHDVRPRLDPLLHDKLDKILESFRQYSPRSPHLETRVPSPSTVLTEETLPVERSSPSLVTPVSKRPENSIRWLLMPWQPLVSSDRGVLLAVEEALSKPDKTLIIHTCELITNVMLQDFPSEVFLQRPSIVTIFHSFLRIPEDPNITSTVLRALHKLTRSLRFRIYYYCDPCIANKLQKQLRGPLDTSSGCSQEDRPPEDLDDSVLQLQQMLLPTYCIDTLSHVLNLLNNFVNSERPLEIPKSILDLSSELVQLLKTSLTPSIWLSHDNVALKIHEHLKSLLKLLGEVLEYLRSYSTVDHLRITYLQLLCITTNLLCSLVPLEVSDYVLPEALKISLSVVLMDAGIFLIFPGLHATIQEYVRQFRGVNQIECLKVFEELKIVTKSLNAAVLILKSSLESQDIVKDMYLSKLSLTIHKNLSIVKKYILILQRYETFTSEDKNLCSKVVLHLLSHGHDEVRIRMYEECRSLVSVVLGVERSRGSWTSVSFLFDKAVLTEIICHGIGNEAVGEQADDILVFLLKGRVQMGEHGWDKFLEAVYPVFPLLQCLGDSKVILGQCVSKMLDPDMYPTINLTYLEVLKGNIRLLFSRDASLREEAIFRLIYLLGMEKNGPAKRPKLSSLHGLPLSSLLTLERQCSFRKPEGSYDRSNLASVLEMLKMPNVEPKVRKSALIQISVMLTDTSLHKLFIKEQGLETVLDVLDKSLIENDFENYPDSVVPIVSILRLIASTQGSVRHELSNQAIVYQNTLRSLFLFPNHETVKLDVSQLFFLLLFNEYVIPSELNISIPEVIERRLRVPFMNKIHWKISPHRRDGFKLSSTNALALTFLRQFWAWEWNNREDVLWTLWESCNDSEINEDLRIREQELSTLKFTSIRFYSQQQLFNIKNSGTHEDVCCALDYLWMYIKLSELNRFEENRGVLTSMPWEQSLERFLLAHPTSQEDCDLLVQVLNFLNVLITVTKSSEAITWVSKTIRGMTASLSELLRSLDKDYQNVHQSVLKLVRSCVNLDKETDEGTMEDFVEIVVSNLCSNDQQHFYNLAYLDWLLNCLTYLTSDAKWKKIQVNKGLVTTLGSSLMELIVSFHGNGAFSFMGLSITKNAIICLNHLLDHMGNKVSFWYENGRMMDWLPTLWVNRDPLVRASALQLLTGLIRAPHSAQQLLHGLSVAPSELLQTLIGFLVNREEACIVREKAAMALGHLVANSKTTTFDYCDSLRANAIIIYMEQANLYYEVSLMCSNLYNSPTLDPSDVELSSDLETAPSEVPRSVLHYYNSDELSSPKDSDDQFVTTPSLLTAVCCLLNSLIIIGQGEVVSKIYESSLDKYFISCFSPLPQPEVRSKPDNFCDIVMMHTSILTVLTNCISHCLDFASSVKFSPDFLYLIMSYLRKDESDISRIQLLRTRLSTEVYNLLSVLSLTENQHLESIKTALESSGQEATVLAFCEAISHDDVDLRMSAVASLGFLLSQTTCNLLGNALDSSLVDTGDNSHGLRFILEEPRKPKIQESVGARISRVLTQLMVAHNYANSKKSSKDKELIMGALGNLLISSHEAKRSCQDSNLHQACLLILKELYTEINLQPQKGHSDREKRLQPLLQNVSRVVTILINFCHESTEVKEVLAEAGLADQLHKLWAWISLNESAVTIALKLMATFTTECPSATQSMTLTTTLPGAGPRRTPNTVSLLNIVIQLVSKEINKASQSFDNQRLYLAFHVLRNCVHVHECRVVIAKSSLMQFFGKIHPMTTKRNKPWPLIEVYCLEFLIDFTFYDEGQVCVPKATDAFEVLMLLAKCHTPASRILAISVLRNLAFNACNRPRVLASMEFMEMLHWIFRNGGFSEIGVAGAVLWALVANNQKGKLIARSAGFAQALQEVLGRLSLGKMVDEAQQRELGMMIQHVVKLIRASDGKSDTLDRPH